MCGIANQEKLNKISQLENNWDGYGSPPISEDVVANVLLILNYVNFELQLFPTGRDSVQIEYFINNDRDGIEIEIFQNEASYSLIKNGDYIIDEDPITIEDAIALLLQFYYN